MVSLSNHDCVGRGEPYFRIAVRRTTDELSSFILQIKFAGVLDAPLNAILVVPRGRGAGEVQDGGPVFSRWNANEPVHVSFP